jgi:hypothetical protein
MKYAWHTLKKGCMIKFDRRRDKRDLFFQEIEYCLGTSSPDDIFEGSIVDISESGMRMFTARPLEEGEDIEIMTALLLPLPYRKATTRWVVKYSQDLYKIGLAFKSVPFPWSFGGSLENSPMRRSAIIWTTSEPKKRDKRKGKREVTLWVLFD